MYATLTTIRTLAGLFIIWQLAGVAPLLIWFQNPSAVDDGTWVAAVIKLVFAVIGIGVFIGAKRLIKNFSTEKQENCHDISPPGSMTEQSKLIILLTTVVTVLLCGTVVFMARYELTASTSSNEDTGHMYRLDRWSGDVAIASGARFVSMTLEPPRKRRIEVKLPAEEIQKIDPTMNISRNNDSFALTAYNGTSFELTRVILSITYKTNTQEITRLFDVHATSYGSLSPMKQGNVVEFKYPDQYDFKQIVRWSISGAYGYKIAAAAQ